MVNRYFLLVLAGLDGTMLFFKRVLVGSGFISLSLFVTYIAGRIAYSIHQGNLVNPATYDYIVIGMFVILVLGAVIFAAYAFGSLFLKDNQ